MEPPIGVAKIIKINGISIVLCSFNIKLNLKLLVFSNFLMYFARN